MDAMVLWTQRTATATALLATLGLGCSAQPTVYRPDVTPSATAPAVEPPVLGELLSRYVSADGEVDYAAWKKAPEDVEAIETYTAKLLEGSPRSAPKRYPDAAAKLSYWINLYNALSLRELLRRWPIEAADDEYARSVLYDLRFDVGGKSMSLLDIETAIIRNRFDDVRALFALHCGARSCPLVPTASFDGPSLQRQLDEATRTFVNRTENVAIHESQGTVVLSPVLGWYRQDLIDFVAERGQGPAPTLLDFLLTYARPDLATALRKARDGRYRITYRPYAWHLRQLDPPSDPLPDHEDISLDGDQRLPGMTLKRLDGSTWSSEAAKGYVILVDVWATWCRPCLMAFPHYAELQLAYEKRGFTVLAVSQDEAKAPVEAFVEANRTAIDVMHDPDHELSEAPLNVSTLPTVLLVDRKGIIRHRHQGYSRPDLDRLKKQIEALLAEGQE